MSAQIDAVLTLFEGANISLNTLDMQTSRSRSYQNALRGQASLNHINNPLIIEDDLPNLVTIGVEDTNEYLRRFRHLLLRLQTNDEKVTTRFINCNKMANETTSGDNTVRKGFNVTEDLLEDLLAHYSCWRRHTQQLLWRCHLTFQA